MGTSRGGAPGRTLVRLLDIQSRPYSLLGPFVQQTGILVATTSWRLYLLPSVSCLGPSGSQGALANRPSPTGLRPLLLCSHRLCTPLSAAQFPTPLAYSCLRAFALSASVARRVSSWPFPRLSLWHPPQKGQPLTEIAPPCHSLHLSPSVLSSQHLP